MENLIWTVILMWAVIPIIILSVYVIAIVVIYSVFGIIWLIDGWTNAKKPWMRGI